MTADAAQAANPTAEHVREKFTVVTLRLSAMRSRPAYGNRPCLCAPQCPHHQEWLKQQPDSAGEVGVETESVSVGEELRDVPGEDHDKEQGGNPSDRRPPLREDDQA